MSRFTNAPIGMGSDLPDLSDPSFVVFYKTVTDANGHSGIYTLSTTGAGWIRVTSAIPTNITLIASPTTWTNMPSAATEFTGNQGRLIFDLTRVDEIRITGRINTATSAGSVLWVQYSTDESNWIDLTTNKLSCSAVATVVTAWEPIPSGARTDAYLRVMGSGGNGTLDPAFRNLALQVR